jgi:hypothetical protein
MDERVGVDLPGRLALQAVVADGRGCAHGLLDVAPLEIACREDAVRPDAGVAVGLELEPRRTRRRRARGDSGR